MSPIIEFSRSAQPRRPGRALGMVLLTVILVLSTASAALAQASPENWWDSAAEETTDQVKTVQETVTQTNEKLSQARDALNQYDEWARTNLSGAAYDAARTKIADAQRSLDAYGQPLKVFEDRMGKVTSAVDNLLELRALASDVQNQRGGTAGQALRVIAVAMQNAKIDAPIIGDVINFYGEATKAILDGVNDIATKVDTNRNQGMFGQGAVGGIDNPLYQALVTQFGDTFASSQTFAPGQYPLLYGSISDPSLTLLWNPDTQTWTKVDQPLATAEALYRSYVIARGHPTTDNLTTLLTTSFEQSENRLNAANDLAALWQGWITNYNLPFDAINMQNGLTLGELMKDPLAFAARFTHDAAFNDQVRQWLNDMYLVAMKDRGHGLGPDEETANAIRAWATKFGITLPALAPPADSGATSTSTPQGPGATQPVTGTTGVTNTATTTVTNTAATTATQTALSSSVVILFDASGSMGDNGKIDMAKSAARNVLSTVDKATEVALIVFYGCGDIQVEHSFTTDIQPLLETINQITPANDTPLADAITFARSYSSQYAHSASQRLVILSDGQETCGGDPVAAAQQ